MSQTFWFTSDLHLSHSLVAKLRGFSSTEEMDKKLYEMFDVVKKGDIVYILGDIGWEPKVVEDFLNYLTTKKKPSKIVIIEGNHDQRWLGKFTLHPRIEVRQTMTVNADKNGHKPIFLSHYPQLIYNRSHYGIYQLHGHGHAETSDRPLLDAMEMGKRINVNCELHDYKLWSRDDIEAEMENKPQNIDYFLCKGTDKQKKKVLKMLKKINKTLKGLEKL